MTKSFSPDHATARCRFRQAATDLYWQMESHAIDALSPGGEQLAFNDAILPHDRLPALKAIRQRSARRA